MIRRGNSGMSFWNGIFMGCSQNSKIRNTKGTEEDTKFHKENPS
jgi:hypothetical protein